MVPRKRGNGLMFILNPGRNDHGVTPSATMASHVPRAKIQIQGIAGELVAIGAGADDPVAGHKTRVARSFDEGQQRFFERLVPGDVPVEPHALVGPS